MAYDLIAAVDLGSNSFRLQVGRVVGSQVYPLDSLKESVRLAAGLTPEKVLDGPSQLRALETLARFGERLRGFAPGAVRAVATNTLRVAKNARGFLPQAEAALGFPIEVIAGREEARLIYLGVAHTLSNPKPQILVVDIGGGSTEFIVGRNFHPLLLESLYMGCVSYSMRFFRDGAVTRKSMREAEMLARKELEAIVHVYRTTGWEVAIGSSGTAKAIADLLEMNRLNPGGAAGITREGLGCLRDLIVHAGNAAKLGLEGLRPDRVPVLPGGLAILCAVFDAFGLEEMQFSDGALRVGVLYDLLGRHYHEDQRESTVTQFMRRYDVDARQAARVSGTALRLLGQMMPGACEPGHADAQCLSWAARLHEIGISVAHSSYHKHSAYILANADMPGFSRRDQARLSRLVLAHRGRIERAVDMAGEESDWLLIFALRIAALLHRARIGDAEPPVDADCNAKGFRLSIDADWLKGAPLTAAALDEEAGHWAGLGIAMRIRSRASRG